MSTAVSPPIHPLLSPDREYPFVTLDRMRARLAPAGVPVINFGIGDPRERTPEFIREALRRAVPEMSSYPAAAGSAELRAACARWAQRRFNVPLDPERHVLPANGTRSRITSSPILRLVPGMGMARSSSRSIASTRERTDWGSEPRPGKGRRSSGLQSLGWKMCSASSRSPTFL